MRTHAVVLAVVVALSLAVGAEGRESASKVPHLRPANAAAGALIADTTSRSATVRDLVAKLDGTDVIAYVAVEPIDGKLRSSIQFAGKSNVQRFVVIKIDPSLSPDRQAERVGHELQHAVEVSRTAWVNDQKDMRQMMTVFGWRTPGAAYGLETVEASAAERAVERELKATAVAVR